MLKRILYLLVLCLCFALFLSGCGNVPGDNTGDGPGGAGDNNSSTGGTGDSDGTVMVRAVNPTLQIKDRAVEGYDLTTLFTIERDGENVPVLPSYIDTGALSQEPGDYAVRCSYEGKSATVTVTVTKTAYTVSLSQESVSIKQTAAKTYDFLSLFSATADGEPYPLTADAVQTDLADEPGNYSYTVRLGDASATLAVRILPDHLLEVIPAYRVLELTLTELADLDPTSLFILFSDGMPVRISQQMVDATALANAKEGGEYPILFAYQEGLASCNSRVTVRVVPEGETRIVGKTVQTYPCSPVIDPTTLFTVTKGDRVIPVTRDMITGSVDYTAEGEYTYTLSYDGKTATATVRVSRGVVITPAAADTVTLRAGTDLSLYPFERDFVVTVNGVRFTDIPISCFDLSGVDFNTPGEYDVTLTIRYNENKLSGITGQPSFKDYSATVRYRVVANTYSIKLGAEELVLPAGTTAYDVYKNLTVTVNGRGQSLTENPDYADIISCYVRLLSDPVDFDSVLAQTVRIAVYVDGPENDPVEVCYTLRVDADVTVTATGAAVFAGQPISLRDLFTVTRAGARVEVTYGMISGRVDLYTPGMYEITLTYAGLETTARVAVLDPALIGTYHTAMTAIPPLETDESGGDGYGDGYGDEEWYAEDVSPLTRLGDLVICADGTVRLNGRETRISGGIDPRTLTFRFGTVEYVLYYEDGIAVLSPDNSHKMGFTEDRRPLIYFHGDVWEVTDTVTVNYSSKGHVLAQAILTYSIDTFCLAPKNGGESIWYGLKIHLVEKTSADTVYRVSWGEVTYAGDFTREEGSVSSLTFLGDTYRFTVLSRHLVKIRQSASDRQWTNRTFTGTVNGQPAVLSTNQYEHYTLTVAGTKVLTAILNGSNTDVGGSVDYAAGTLYLYDISGKEGEPYSYMFRVDAENDTFTLAERDPYYGKYVLGNRYLFLDGYGGGHMNFSTASYAVTPITYTVDGRELYVRYHPVSPAFAYGDGASYYISTLLNVLTVRDFPGADLAGRDFRNTVITDGAIVEFTSKQLAASVSGKNQLLSQIRIITADGEMDMAAKTACIDTTAVKFTAGGFYQFSITVQVGGEDVVCYYAVQVLDALYEDSALATAWGAGLFNAANTLAIDPCGQVTLCLGTVTYTGLAQIDGEGFLARVYDANRALITLRGSLVAPGILGVSGTGAASMQEVFTTGTVRAAGTAGIVLREITVGGTAVYYLSDSPTALGVPAAVSAADGGSISAIGTVLSILPQGADTPVYARVALWGDLAKGLVAADGYRGVYTVGDVTLILDGFGTAVFGTDGGTYRLNGNVATVSFIGGNIRVFRLDRATLTGSEVSVPAGNALLEGRTFRATYNFSCGYYLYGATTAFAFGADGRVTVTSVSPAHDAGEDACDEDVYSPSFASAAGVVGTYTVTGDTVTVQVGGETFRFRVTNVLDPTSIVCESTTVASDAHGYFRTGTAFSN